METTLSVAGKSIPIHTEGSVLTDYQVLWMLRHEGVITADAEYSIGVGLNHTAELCRQAKTASGHISRRIESLGGISIPGYHYMGHSINTSAIPRSGQQMWSFIANNQEVNHA